MIQNPSLKWIGWIGWYIQNDPQDIFFLWFLGSCHLIIEILWVFVFFKHSNLSVAAVYYAKSSMAKCTIHSKCGFPIPCPWTFVYLKGKRCILNWPVARLRTFFCQITNIHLISMLYTVRLRRLVGSTDQADSSGF